MKNYCVHINFNKRLTTAYYNLGNHTIQKYTLKAQNFI